jgi:hypothetical protein
MPKAMNSVPLDASTEPQRFGLGGRIWRVDDPGLQDVLAEAHAQGTRPMCLCVRAGVEMYVARHQRYLVKRMPESGHHHHPACPSFEPDAAGSGLGRLLGDAVLEPEPGKVELRVRFPWARMQGRAAVRSEAGVRGEVSVPRRPMSLRALLHYLFERAGFNRWTPAMEGRRNQAVLHKYLLEAAADVAVKGARLSDRLYVPEPFQEAAKEAIAQRRRDKLALLQPRDGHAPLGLVIGELKACEPRDAFCRVWVRHMPDAPLLLDARTWERVARSECRLLQAGDADGARGARLALCALIRSRRPFTYEIDTLCLMLASAQWLPVEAADELPLVDALVAQRRRFLKPLRYDAPSAAAFPNVLLLDCGNQPVPLHLTGDHLSAQDQAQRRKAIQASREPAWVWDLGQPMPPLPAAGPAARSTCQS